MKRTFLPLFLLLLASCAGPKWSEISTDDGFNVITQKKGQTLGYSSASGVAILEDKGYAFKDMNRNGVLDPYEDWRLPAEERAAELNDKYLRTMAEYDNFRKRTEKEKADIYTFAAKDVLTKVLPVLDNFERGLAQLPEEKKDDPVAEGMEKIYKQFEKALADLGVEPIEAVGHAFDPDFHNAVMHVEDEEAGDNVVVEELMRGYTYKGTVIRYAMVKVAN